MSQPDPFPDRVFIGLIAAALLATTLVCAVIGYVGPPENRSAFCATLVWFSGPAFLAVFGYILGRTAEWTRE